MPGKTRSYRELRAERLANPEVAAHYLEVTRQNSPERHTEAVQHVAVASQRRTNVESLRVSIPAGAGEESHK